jgi:nicotinamide-nucleotide amidase
MPPSDAPNRHILAAEILSIGTELTVGETRDTNAGDLARTLTEAGVAVRRIVALPDELAAVTDAFLSALRNADVVVSTGGLGPTPDDLTREAIAAACSETPHVDADLETWLRGLWSRRSMEFAEINLKQAWLIPSATPIPNRNGTAPGWWVERPDGGLVVALPGPPREMRPMWDDWVLPRLRERGLGRETAVRVLRLTGIGESQVAELLGEEMLRAANPVIATYARADAVDVRISAVAGHRESHVDRMTAAEIAENAEGAVVALLGEHVWARGPVTWSEAIGDLARRLGWNVAAVEVGLGGTLTTLLGDASWLAATESRRVRRHGQSLEAAARAAREESGVDVGIAVEATARGDDTAVKVVVVTPMGTHTERRLAFLGGAQGRSRAALTAAAVLLARLRVAETEMPATVEAPRPRGRGARGG